ncbi:hypothetical protein GCM10010405_18070 [Streptomyces macrosporus]|uniref:Uncharacterized protein n=1 Tax=Streptomyces macrosporus TaxID=44032 RepID=A0ABP5WWL6_9ACTN
MAKDGGQVVRATHSPLPTALPGADIVEVGEHGMRRVAWHELALVDHWRRCLADPRSYLRHVLDRGDRVFAGPSAGARPAARWW